MRFRSTHPAAAGAGLVLLLAAAAFAQDPPAGEEDFLRPNAVTADHAGESLVVEGRVAEVRRTNAGLHLYFGADMTSAFQCSSRPTVSTSGRGPTRKSAIRGGTCGSPAPSRRKAGGCSSRPPGPIRSRSSPGAAHAALVRASSPGFERAPRSGPSRGGGAERSFRAFRPAHAGEKEASRRFGTPARRRIPAAATEPVEPRARNQRKCRSWRSSSRARRCSWWTRCGVMPRSRPISVRLVSSAPSSP